MYKAKAELRNVYQAVIDSRLKGLKEHQIAEAEMIQEKLRVLSTITEGAADIETPTESIRLAKIGYSRTLDPEPLLKIRLEDKGLEVIGEAEFLSNVVSLTCSMAFSFDTNPLVGFGS